MSLIRFPLTNRGDSRMALSTSSHVSKVIRAKSALPGPFLLSGIWTAVTYRISGEKRTYMSITIEMALKLLRSDGCVQTSNERTTGTGRIRMTVTVIPAVIVTGGGRRRKRRRLAHRTARRIVVAVLHVSVVRIHGGAPHGVGHGVVGRGGASVAVVIVVIIGTGSITRRVLRLVHHRGGNGLGRVIDARGSRAGGIGAGSRIITHVGLRGLVGSVAVAVVAGLVLGMEGVAATRVGRVIITVVVSVVTGRTIIIVVITTVVIATIIIATVIIASVVITAVVITAIVIASVVIATIVIATMIIVVVVPRALVGG